MSRFVLFYVFILIGFDSLLAASSQKDAGKVNGMDATVMSHKYLAEYITIGCGQINQLKREKCRF